MVRHLEYATVSLAKAYASQGHTEEALVMYRHLLSQNPDDQGLKDAVSELENTAATDADFHAVTPAPTSDTDELVHLVQTWIQWMLRYKKMMMIKKLQHLNQ